MKAVRTRKRRRTCDAHGEDLPAVHELVELDGLQEPRVLQVLAGFQLVALEEDPVRLERSDAFVEAYLRLLRPLCRLCVRGSQYAAHRANAGHRTGTGVGLMLTAVCLLPTLLVAHGGLPAALLGTTYCIQQLHRLQVVVMRGLYRVTCMLYCLSRRLALYGQLRVSGTDPDDL